MSERTEHEMILTKIECGLSTGNRAFFTMARDRLEAYIKSTRKGQMNTHTNHGMPIGAFTKEHYAVDYIRKLVGAFGNGGYTAKDFVIVFHDRQEFKYEVVLINYKIDLDDCA